MQTAPNTGRDGLQEELRLSDEEVVRRYWNLLPSHIQKAIDITGANKERSTDMITAGLRLGFDTDAQVLARAKLSRVLRGLKSLGELPKDLDPGIQKQLDKRAVENRASMLRGNDIMTLIKNNSPYPGIDLFVDADTGTKVRRLLEALKDMPEEMSPHALDTFGNEAVRISLPRGAYNVTMGGIQIYGDYKGKWQGHKNHYRSHYDEKTDRYYEAVGCPDCDEGPDLRNATKLIHLDHNVIVAIHGYQPPNDQLPVFYQNPNYFPDGTAKGGRQIPVFYEKLGG